MAVASSMPGGIDIVTATFAGMALAALGLVWITAFLVQSARHYSRGAARGRWLLAAPVIVVVSVGLMAARVPLNIRWRLSEGAFDTAAKSVPLPSNGDDRRGSASEAIGSYNVSLVQRGSWGVSLVQRGSWGVSLVQRGSWGVAFTILGGGTFLSEAGFAYMPHGTHDFIGDHHIQFAPLDNGWYEWLWND